MKPTNRTLMLFGPVVLALCLFSEQVAAKARPSGREAEQAFEGAQWIMASAAARAVSQVGARAAAGDGPLGDLIRQRQDIEAEYAKQQKQQLDALKTGAAADATLNAAIAGLNKTLNDLDVQIALKFPKYAELANPRPLNFAATQALLKPDEALILMLTDRHATYVWVVTKTSAAWNRAEIGSDALDKAVRAMRLTLDPNAPVRSAESLDQTDHVGLPLFDRALAYQLYQTLFAPFDDVLKDTQHAFIIADGPLSSLPLSVLITEPPQGQDDDPAALRQTAWLAKTLATTTLPAVSSLTVIRGGVLTGRHSETMSFVGFGAPDFRPVADGQPTEVASLSTSGFFTRGLGNVTAIRGLSPLPGTARELNQIGTILGAENSRVYLGREATEAAVKSADLTHASIVAFATHGLVTGELTGLAEPALVLTPPALASDTDDGLLTASEASALKLSADWVILSACNTAASDGTPGASGLSGLARAFLFAGARAVLVSHWPVRDDVAARLTTRTLALLAANPDLGRSKALHKAMVEVIMDDKDPTLAHPSAWAPFVIVGEGG